MPTQDEKNLALNRFMEWEPNQRCRDDFGRVDMPTGWECACGALLEEQWEEHDIPPFNYYEDTPAARERTMTLIFAVNERGLSVCVGPTFAIVHDERGNNVGECPHTATKNAILDAIYEAIK